MPLLDSNDAVAIRTAIHISITEAQCPWERIEQKRYSWRAEQWVTSRVDLDGLDEDQLEHAHQAAIAYCAHLLAKIVTPMKSESHPTGSSYSQDVMSPAQKSRELLAEAEAELAFLTEEDEITLAHPGSGSVPTHSVW